MTYQEAIDYIHSTAWGQRTPGLSRITHLCEALRHPEKALRVIHVAGTNGKGSTCAMLNAILIAAGYRVGLYTSPYIRRFNERMQVNGTPISDAELAILTAQIRPIADAMEERPTEFELITAIAFDYFAKQKCDVVILEVGLGGRLDSTNVIEQPLLSIITDIDLDHTAILGDTIEAIAKEKAGIIKPNCPCLYGGRDNGADRTIGQIARIRQAPFYQVDRTQCKVLKTALSGTEFDYGSYHNLHLSLLGSYQPSNASIVLEALSIIEKRGFEIPESAIREGLCAVKWPARFELLRKDPIVLYDGGHNPQGIAAAVSSIKQYFPERKVNILIGVMQDKNHSEMIGMLSEITHHAFTVRPETPRAMPAEELAEELESHRIPATPFATFKDAVHAALEASRRENRPLIALGSLYLYGSVVDLLKSE